MATTTTNFGWDIPQSTDLVKDGATAIAALGQDIDTAFVDLKGGTTGQVLAKASNTDLDYSWVAQDDSNAIQNAIVDAKGDLIAASAADTPARLAVGSNGESLVADSSTSTGLRWQGRQEAGKNAIINGGMDIWQRGTSSTLNNGYGSADRWYQYIGAGTGTYARESTVIPAGAQYSLKFTASSAGTSQSITQYIETANCIFFNNKTVTISGQFAASTSVPMTYVLQYSTTVDAGTAASWTTISATSGGTATPTSTTFVTMTGTYAVPSVANSLRLIIQPVSTIASGVVVYHGLVQIELGSVATSFTRAGGTIQGELAACQRYYYRTSGGNAYYLIGSGYAQSSTAASGIVAFPVTMRTTPTSFANGSLYVEDSGSAGSVTSTATYANASTNSVKINLTSLTGVAPTAHRPVLIYTNNSSSSYVSAEAEL